MRILFYGDSNTWGFDARTGYRIADRFTALVQQAFCEDTIIEEGLCGRTFCFEDPYSLECRNGTKTFDMVVKSQLPLDYVVVMLGTNDAKRIFHTNALSSMEKAADLFLQTAKNPNLYKHAPYIPQFLMVPPVKMNRNYRDIPYTYVNFGDEGFQMLETLPAALQKICLKHGADFLDLGEIRAGDYDAIHMDEAAHRAVAEKLIERIRRYHECQK